MTPEEQEAVRTLGWTETSWTEGDGAAFEKVWSELSPAERAAAEKLGLAADDFTAAPASPKDDVAVATPEKAAPATDASTPKDAAADSQQASSPMEVDSQGADGGAPASSSSPAKASSEEALCLEVYNALIGALMSELQGSKAAQEGQEAQVGLQPGQQLLAFLHAARLGEHKDAILKTLVAGKADAVPELPKVYSKIALAARAALEAKGLWNLEQVGGLSAKSVLAHRSALKFIKFPLLPKSAKGCTVYLREKAADGDAVNLGGGLCFNGCDSHPLTDMEKSGLAIVLKVDDIEAGTRIVVSPLLASQEETEAAAQAISGSKTQTRLQREQLLGRLSEKFIDFVSKEARAWQGVLDQESKRFHSDASKKTLQRALRVAAERPWTAGKSVATPVEGAATADGVLKTITPQKRKGGEVHEGADETPPEKKEKGGDADEASQKAGHDAYGKLVGALFKELGFFVDADNGWLDVKKELLIYHHAAALNEHKEVVLGAIRGDDSLVAKLPNAHQRVLGSVRGQIMSDLAAAGNVKVKRIFGHEHVIKFSTPPKGLPIPKHSCVFLRERPQATSDTLRKTPSLFRDVVRFKCIGNPLTQLEEHGLALVMTVTQYQPRAFLVMSPFLQQPDLLAQNAHKTWPEIEQNLKDSLHQWIARDCDAWSAFMQRHGHLMTKDSLKTLQKVLKSYKPDPRALPAADAETWRNVSEEGEGQGLRILFEELAMAREELRVRKADASAKEGAQASAQAAEDDAKAEAQQEAEMLQERLKQAEESLSEYQKENSTLKSEKERLVEEKEDLELKAEVLQEKADALQEKVSSELSKQQKKELDNSLKKKDKEMVKQRQHLEQEAEQAQASAEAWQEEAAKAEAKARDEVEKAKTAAKEKVATAKSENDAAIKEHTRLAGEQVQAARETLAEARQAEAQARAELELKVQTIAQLTESNVELRAQAAKAKDVEAAADAKIAEAREQQAAAESLKAEAESELARKAAEVAKLLEDIDSLKQEMAKKEEKRLEADEKTTAAVAAEAESRKAEALVRAEMKAKNDEVQRLTQTCAEKQAEAELKVKEAEGEAAEAQAKALAAEEVADEARKEAIHAKEEVKLKAETLGMVQEANATLRAEANAARESEGRAVAKIEAAERAAEASHEKELQARTDLAAKCEEVLGLKTKNDGLQAQVLDAKAAEQVAQAANAEAQRLEAEARSAKVIAEAELQPKIDEIERLTKACVALQAEAARAKEEAGFAIERAQEAEQATAEARKQEAQAVAEFQVKAATAETLSMANGELRKEMLSARKEAAEADQRAEEATKAKTTAEASTAKAVKQEAAAQAAAKKSEKKAAAAEEKAASAEESRRKMETLVGSLQEAAAAARSTEVIASAELQVKKDEVERLNKACAQLAAVAKSLHREVEDWKNSAAVAETASAEVKAQLMIALKSSELTEEEVQRLAKEAPKADAGSDQAASSSPSKAADGKRKADATDADILADIEQALLASTWVPPAETEKKADSTEPETSPTRKLRRRPSLEDTPGKRSRLGSLALHGPRAKSRALAEKAQRLKKRRITGKTSASKVMAAAPKAKANKAKKSK